MLNTVLFLVIILITNIIEAITGFGGTMLAMPWAMKVIDITDAKVILNVISLTLAIATTVRYHKYTNYKEVFKMSAIMLLGVSLGLYLYAIIPIAFLQDIYAVILIFVAVRGLYSGKSKEYSNRMLYFILIIAGVVHGMFLSGGAFIIIYAVHKLKDKSVIRSSVAPVWIVLNGFIFLQDIFTGRFQPSVIRTSLYCILPLSLAFVIGGYLHKKMNQSFFVKMTYVLLTISGVMLLI